MWRRSSSRREESGGGKGQKKLGVEEGKFEEMEFGVREGSKVGGRVVTREMERKEMEEWGWRGSR